MQLHQCSHESVSYMEILKRRESTLFFYALVRSKLQPLVDSRSNVTGCCYDDNIKIVTW